MSRTFRLTRRAENSLVEIARWTIEKFGLRQAEFMRLNFYLVAKRS